MADIKGLKSYLRFMPEDDVDLELIAFFDAAENYVVNAGVPAHHASGLYDILVYMVAGHWYENRGVTTDAYRITNLPMGAVSLINQLRSMP